MNSSRHINLLVGTIVLLGTMIILGLLGIFRFPDLLNNIIAQASPTLPPTSTPTQTSTSTPTQTQTTVPSPTSTSTATPAFTPTPAPAPQFKDIGIDQSIRCDLDDLNGPSNQFAQTYYVVGPADTLSGIAFDWYGNKGSQTYQSIFEETNQRSGEPVDGLPEAIYARLDDYNLIRAGQVLYMPPAEVVQDRTETEVEALNEIDPATLSNPRIKLNIVGSSTVHPISLRIATCFKNGGFGGTINISRDGSIQGLKFYCQQEDIDVLDASVEFILEDADIGSGSAYCAEKFQDLVKLQIGNDAIALVVSKENPHLESFRQGEVISTTLSLTKALLNGETISGWQEVAEGRESTSDIVRYFPGDGSGTLLLTAFLLYDRNESAFRNTPNIAENCVDGSKLDREDDDQIARCIAADPNGIGFIPYSAYLNHADELSLIALDGRLPLPESIDSQQIENRYPLFRPVYIYVSKTRYRSREAVAAFTNYYLTRVNRLIVDVGLFPLSQEELANSIEQIRCEIEEVDCE